MDQSQHHIHNHDAREMLDHSSMAVETTIDSITIASTVSNEHADHMPSSHAGHGDAMNHMMSMAFHFGCEETILFTWWKIQTVAGLICSMLAIFIMAVLYEGLKYYREYLFWKTYNLLEYRPVTGPKSNPEDPQRPTPSTTASPVQYVGEVINKQPPTMFSLHHLFQTCLHILQVTLSFLLMLIFMTYNVWLCVAVVLGAAVGYFLFCWKKSVIVDVTEHCH